MRIFLRLSGPKAFPDRPIYTVSQKSGIRAEEQQRPHKSGKSSKPRNSRPEEYANNAERPAYGINDAYAAEFGEFEAGRTDSKYSLRHIPARTDNPLKSPEQAAYRSTPLT